MTKCVILSDLLQNLNLALQHVSLIIELLHELLVSANRQSDISIYKKLLGRELFTAANQLIHSVITLSLS